MLEELDTIANELNISRQAVIKTYLRQALSKVGLKSKAMIFDKFFILINSDIEPYTARACI